MMGYVRNEPKIVFFDLEIIPDLKQALKHWPMLSCRWDTNTLKAQVSSICCFGYKIYNENMKAKCINAWDFDSWEKDVNDDKQLCIKAREILEDADAVVFQNGDRFDMPYFNTRLIKHGLQPLPNIPTIDLKKVSKRHIFLLSNSLKNQALYLTNDRKMDHGLGWELWEHTHNKIKKYMSIMSKYCRQDVDVMEPIFKVYRPFIKNIPNHNLFQGPGTQNVCPNCGGTRLKSHGWRYTKTNSYRRYMCLGCGSVSRTDKGDNMPRSV